MFTRLNNISNLSPYSTKTQFIPLRLPYRIQSLRTVRDKLIAFLPVFATAKVSFAIDCLMFIVRPKLSDSPWKKQIRKFEARFDQLSSAQRAASVTVPIYHMSIISIFTYVCQLYKLPDTLLRREVIRLHQSYKFIPFSLPLAAFAHMKPVGLTNVNSQNLLRLLYCIAVDSVLFQTALKQHGRYYKA